MGMSGPPYGNYDELEDRVKYQPSGRSYCTTCDDYGHAAEDHAPGKTESLTRALLGLCARGCGDQSLLQLTDHYCEECEDTYIYCPSCAEEL